MKDYVDELLNKYSNKLAECEDDVKQTFDVMVIADAAFCESWPQPQKEHMHCRAIRLLLAESVLDLKALAAATEAWCKTTGTYSDGFAAGRKLGTSHEFRKPKSRGNVLYAHIGDDGQWVEVFYDYSPAERMTRTYPGAPEEIIINDVLTNGRSVFNDLSEKCIDRLIAECWREQRGER